MLKLKMIIPKLQFVLACFSSYASLASGGVCLSWIEPLTSWYQSQDSSVPMTEDQVSLVVSLIEVGAVFAPIPTGFLADSIGRKLTILLTALVALVGFLIVLFSGSFAGVCVARVLSGVSLGALCTVTPVYLAEISPTNIRGALCGQLTASFFLGQLLAYVAGHFLSYSAYLWVCVAFPLLSILSILVCPESPSYLLKAGRPDRAMEAIKALRGTCDPEEFEAAKASIVQDSGVWNGLKLLLRQPTLKVLIVLQLLSFISHANGLPTLSLYATSTFGGRLWLTLGMGGLLVASSCLASFLTDPFGRRPLLALSLAGSALATALIAVHFITGLPWLLYLGTLAFCFISSVGITPLIMTLQGELFPSSTRAIASGITELTLALASFLSLISYLPVSDNYGMEVNFFVYTALSTVGFFVVMFFLPETARTDLDAAEGQGDNDTA